MVWQKEIEGLQLSDKMRTEVAKIENGKPLCIRLHHLPLFQEVLRGAPKEDVSPEKFEVAKRGGGVLVSGVLAWGWIYGSGYYEDVLGPSGVGLDQYRDGVTADYLLFLGLPADHPVEVVLGKPDVLCAACHAGKHCYEDKPREADSAALVIWDQIIEVPTVMKLGELKEKLSN